jgi:hypothetical protein
LLATAVLFLPGCAQARPVGKTPAGQATGQTALEELKKLIEDIPGAAAYRYHAMDSAGNTMDTAKIIADPEGGYLAVYHTYNGLTFEVHLATSEDLMNWTYRQSYGSRTHQPYLAAVPGGGFLLANEADNGFYNWIQVRFYESREALLGNLPARTIDLPHTQVPEKRWAEGTPNIYSVSLNPDIDNSSIEVGFHYFMDGQVDRQARGVFKDFRTWTSEKQSEIDSALLEYNLKGNIGDRDRCSFLGRNFNLQEGQFIGGDFGSWRVFLWEEASGEATQLEILTHGGSQAFANPTCTLLTGPEGGQALVVTLFIPSENSALGEAGELIYFKNLKDK